MAMKHYEGSLGKFDYDDSKYELMKDDEGEYLHYASDNMSDIIIPEGIVDCSNMFMGVDIEYPPVIPDGVVSTKSMFTGCKNLKKGAVVPDTVVDQSFMYDNCSELKKIPDFSPNVKNLKYACANCGKLEEIPQIPSGAEETEGVAFMCKSLNADDHSIHTILQITEPYDEPDNDHKVSSNDNFELDDNYNPREDYDKIVQSLDGILEYLDNGKSVSDSVFEELRERSERFNKFLAKSNITSSQRVAMADSVLDMQSDNDGQFDDVQSSK